LASVQLPDEVSAILPAETHDAEVLGYAEILQDQDLQQVSGP